MSLDPFIQSISNATRSPWTVNHQSKKFAEEISKKTLEWIEQRKGNRKSSSEFFK
jgi:hypothetical protein